jgi:hypothetical protein
LPARRASWSLSGGGLSYRAVALRKRAGEKCSSDFFKQAAVISSKTSRRDFFKEAGANLLLGSLLGSPDIDQSSRSI